MGQFDPMDPSRQTERRPIRFAAFGLATVLVFSLLTVRLGYLQVANGPVYAARADANRTVSISIPAPRGLIYDRQGRPLAVSVATYSVKIKPSDLPYGQRQTVAARLSAMLGIPAADILATVDSSSGSRFDPVRVAREVPEATARLIAESTADLPGVEVAIETRRSYPAGGLVGHILGYTGPIDATTYARLRNAGYLPDDMIGKTGLESSYESDLRGTYGRELVERDASGRDIQVLQTTQQPVPGASLNLAIDTTIQQEATDALKWGMKIAGLNRGTFIVMNPQTGEVLALVSLPAIDNNLFAAGISNADFQRLLRDPAKPLIDNTIQSQYAPGSTFKLVTGSGALQDKKLTSTTKIQTKPYITLANTKYWDWNRRGFGMCDMACGFGNSSDTFFYQVAVMLGTDRLAFYAKQFGFGAPTGIDLPGEVSGIVPSNQWKIDTFGQPMYSGEVAQAGIGQGYDAVTPIQLITAYCALANGGRLYKPQVVRTITGSDGSVIRDFTPELIRKVPISAKNLRDMRLAARATVTLRHTYNLVDLPVKVAGKSGTAEFDLPDAQGRLPFHSWFVGWVNKNPYSADFTKTDSELAFLAFAYDSRTVGNAATEIAKSFLQFHYHIKHDYRLPKLLKKGNFYGSG